VEDSFEKKKRKKWSSFAFGQKSRADGVRIERGGKGLKKGGDVGRGGMGGGTRRLCF